MSKDLGISTAYGYAVSRGYTGTEEEFAELMASYAHVAEDARASAETASNAKDDAVSAKNTAVTSAQTASNKASEAVQSAQNASASASTASTKAAEASASASNAQTSASTASTKATEAASSATAANSAKADAVNAKNAAQTAKTASETARTAAEEAQASAEQAAQEAHDTLDKKAEIDGYYEEMTVGDAEQLVSSQYVSDSVPYLYRTTGGSADVGNREYMESIVGGTIAWNQLVQNGNFENVDNWDVSHSTVITASASNNILSVSVNADGDYRVSQSINIIEGHKYLWAFDAKSETANSRIAIFYVGNTSTYKGFTAIDTNWHNYATVISCVGVAYRQLRLENSHANTTNQFKNINVFDLTQMFGSTIADYIYSLEQANAGAGVAWFKKLFPNMDAEYSYNVDPYDDTSELITKKLRDYEAGILLSVEGLTSHDTVGFNQWDEEWETGVINKDTGENESSSSNIRSKNYIPVLPSTNYYYYFKDRLRSVAIVLYYDENKNYIGTPDYGYCGNIVLKTPDNCHYVRFYYGASYGTTYNHDISINLSWSGWRNGEYEPYQKHSYPLDSSLVLRGIPKLDASNNLYYDGDVYNHDGTVERRYGIVDLGSLSWGGTGETYFNAQLTDASPTISQWIIPNGLCNKYALNAMFYLINDASRIDKQISCTSDIVRVTDSAYSSASDFKTAMSGVYLIYELATPTTEEAEPFQEVQICDDFGTEEFVSTGIVPVGHNTEYPANLRDKLQHLPNLADADGYYMIKQTDKQMSLEHFRIPKAPTEDGEYVLHATVSGGTPTYSWKTEEETA